MATDWYIAANNVSSTIAEDIDDAVTEVDVATGTGADFPATPFLAVIGGVEVVECTDVTGDTLTIARGEDGSAATAHYDGDTIEVTVCAGYIGQIQTSVSALETGGGDLSEPGEIGGTTPAAITGTTVTATTGLAVTRAGETTAGVTLTNSTGANVIRANGANLEMLDQTGNVRLRLDGSSPVRINAAFIPLSDNVRDLGAPTANFRHLYLSGDAYIGGGDIYGPDDGDLSIHSDQDIILRLDVDAGFTPGTHKLIVKNGTAVNVLELGEDGALTIKDDTGSTTLFSISNAGVVTCPALAVTTAASVASSLTVGGAFRTTTVTTFTADDTTPTVAGANIFKTAATGSAVTITGLTNATAGQHIYILPTASPVTTISAAAITNRSTDWLSDAGDVLHLLYDGTNFWEI